MLRRFFIFIAFTLCAVFPSDAFAQQGFAPYHQERTPEDSSALPDAEGYDFPGANTMVESAPSSPVIEHADNLPSALEEIYIQRAGEPLQQFGYRLFETESGHQHNNPLGAVQDDYIIGSGDSLQITFGGQRTDQGSYTVTPEGTILIPDLPPVAAAGRNIADLRATLEATVSKLHNTQIYVSLASVGQIGVLVIGHVKNPGLKTLTSFHTIMDALIESGGVEKTGSLRAIKLVRHGAAQSIDVYDLFINDAKGNDFRLRDGDRLIVPPIGETFALAGDIKRPGIYELPSQASPAQKSFSVENALMMAGGMLTQGNNRLLMLEPAESGMETTTQIKDFSGTYLHDGTVLLVEKGDEKRSGTILLKGNSRQNGIHDYSRNNTLSKLISGQDVLGDDVYPLIGVIKRWNADQMATSLMAFPLRLVLKKEFDQNLVDGDEVYLFSNHEIATLQEEKNTTTHNKSQVEREIEDFLKENAVFIRGAVRKAGLYPVAEGTTLDTLIFAAGGLTSDANTQNIEITSFHGGEDGRAGTQRNNLNLSETSPSTIPVYAGDTIRINQTPRKIEEKTVLISGEILSPGKYDLIAGDKLSDLLARAGGLTEQAYPEGTIFSRESERRAEETRYRAQAKDMESALAASLQQEKDRPDANQIAMVRELAQTLSTVEAVGRITVESDPSVLRTQPELDVLLEAGDRIFIPKRPSSVRVSGEVLSPAALQFRQDNAPLDYIEQAGSFTFHADKDRAFVLFPDGSAQPLQVSSWSHKPVFIPPGSTIVVPRDPKPFDFIQSAKDISQILSNLAVTAIFVDDIRD